MNHTLKAIARAIFKSCFVDFDPVRDPGQAIIVDAAAERAVVGHVIKK